MIHGRGAFASLLFLLLALALVPRGAAQQAAAAEGRITLPAGQDQPLLLAGQWGFAWKQFIDPDWHSLPTAAFAPVPSNWNDVVADGKSPGPEGWGSYALLVDCPRGTSLAVEAVGQRTASRLFINGQQVAAHGRPGTSPLASAPAVHSPNPISPEFACPLRLTLHVSNFHHRAGGAIRPIPVASANVLATHRESRAIYQTGLLAAYLITGVVALIFFAVRRRERTPLVFGLFCLAMCLYTDSIGERLLLRLGGGTIAWQDFMHLEYLSWLAAMALFLLTLRGLFPAEIHKRVAVGVLAALGVSTAAVMLLPPTMYSYLALPGQAIAVVIGGYVAVVMMRADRRIRRDARVLLAGMLAIVATLVLDLLLIDARGLDRKFVPIGFALFMLSPVVVIARRMSQALNAEERSHTLEENARLREDVERMSRHDLKTPLNSILGATRLLRDDGRLNTDQRELVGLLQRAGLRMLEMVNLSLGLFRMETGSYDFRPQAVDLREVVTRVLVDLHSYADANAVALHLGGSHRSALYVRGEELLCYSIVANLVKNAIEASGPGGQVSVALRAGDPVQLTVHNRGVVPAAVAERFFEKYVTLGKSGGTGLGTYSARLMARAQEGELQLRTSAGEGTILTLSLRPLKEEPSLLARAVPVELPVEQLVAGMPARDALVVDDDEYTRLVTRRFLPTPPFSVETAANGQAAIEAMGRGWPHFLLLDMEMPLMDGIEVARWVREREAMLGLPRCRVVMLSGNDDAPSAARALAAGADRFLVKPVRRDLLLATLRELEDGLPSLPAPLSGFGDSLPAAAPAIHEPASAADELVLVDPEWIEYFPEFLRGWRETVEAMARALAAGDREDIRFLGHRAGGGLATVGLHWAARQCRGLERDALQLPADELARRIEGLREHLKKVRAEAAPARP